jgi:uncharacterized protein (TIGR00297 family)
VVGALVDLILADARGIALTAAAIGAAIASAEILYRWGVGVEHTRKLAHVGAGLWCMLLPWFIRDVRTVGLLAVGYCLLLVGTQAAGLLPSIHRVGRRTLGAALYPLGVALAAPLTWDRPPLFLASVLILAVGDALAALIGARWGRHPYAVGNHWRSVEGSAALYAVSALAATLVLGPRGLAVGLLLGAVVATAEALSLYGLDNVLVPVTAAVTLRATADLPLPELARLGVDAAVAAAIAGVALARRNLTVSGALAAWLIGFTVLALAGVAWFLPVLVVFAAVNAASRIRRGQKGLQGKGSTRDHAQIFANAGATVPAVIGWALTHDPLFQGAFVGVLAFAAADTLASEIGALSPRPPRSILTLRPVTPGESGGVSALGYAAALGASLLPGLALGAGAVDAGSVLAGLGAGLVGTTVDSVVGDRLQARFRCHRCGSRGEQARCCGSDAELVRGIRAVDNDAVNLIGSLVSAGVGAALIVALPALLTSFA